MIKATSIRKGKIIKYEGQLYEVIKIDHITPGKGNAIMQVRVRNIETGKSTKLRFRSAEVVETIHFEAIPHQYHYCDGDIYYFMNLKNYHTIELSSDIVDDYKDFLLENMEVGIAFYEGRPVHIEFPKFLNFKVAYAEPWIKGDSVSNNTKPVKIETGYELKVPMFINEGDIIKVDTETGEYMERSN